MTQEEFDEIKDLRVFLRGSKLDRTADCLHYLGDKAQLQYHYNGWITYRTEYENYKNRHQIPGIVGRYLVCRKDGKIHFENWNGSGFAYNDNTIIYWQEIPKIPKK